MPTDSRTHLQDLLLSCIQCGLCLPVCATYLVSGDESWSPRGRLLLLGEALSDDAADPEISIARAWDHCLGCRACEAVCPSGTPYELLAYARELAIDESTVARRRLAGVLTARTAAETVKLAGTLVGKLATRWSINMPMIDAVPTAPSDSKLIVCLDELCGLESWPHGVPAASTTSVRVALLSGCANSTFLSDSQRRLQQVLAALGVDVIIPEDQECCGALPEHAYNAPAAMRLRERNTDVLREPLQAVDALLVEASGCSAYMQEYPPEIREKSHHVLDYLDRLTWPALREVKLRVAIHDPCHARHLLNLHDQPRDLLRRIPGLRILEPREIDVCCGSGGPYALYHQSFSTAMGRRKAEVLLESGADLIVTSNPGCQGQVAAGLKASGRAIPILSLTDLLWYTLLQ